MQLLRLLASLSAGDKMANYTAIEENKSPVLGWPVTPELITQAVSYSASSCSSYRVQGQFESDF